MSRVYADVYPPNDDTPAKREKFVRLIKRHCGGTVVFDGDQMRLER